MNNCCRDNADVCDCDCHTEGSVHVIACCSTCPHCKKRIRREVFESHVPHCETEHARPKNFNDPDQLARYETILKKHLGE